MKFEMLSNSEIERIHDSSIELLTKTGVRFGSQHALEVLASAGCQVIEHNGQVKIPEAVLDQILNTTSDHFRLWNRDGTRPVDLRDGQIRGHNVGSCVRIFDLQSRQARPATQQDLERMTTLIDALENIHVCRPVVYPAEFPASLWDIHTAATMLQFTDKPYGISAYSLENLAYILQITGMIAGGLENLKSRPFIWGSICPDSPLAYSQATAEILMRYAELGLPVAIAPCPVSGGSSPVTLAGTLVQLNAEFLAGLALVQVIHPGIDVKYTARPLPMNMRTGNANFGAIEMGMMSAAIVQLARRYRVCSDVYGLGTSAKFMDERAAYEKATNGMLVAMAGADLVAAAGLLENALVSSPEQLVIDNDLFGMIFRAVRGIELNTDTLAIEQIMQAGSGGSYLAGRHTRKFMRKEHFQPWLSQPSGDVKASGEDEATILDIAADRVKAILDSHHPPSLPAEMVTEVRRCLDLATRSLSGK